MRNSWRQFQIVCDRCQLLSEWKDGGVPGDTGWSVMTQGPSALDLCPDCTAAFDEFKGNQPTATTARMTTGQVQ